LTQTLCDFDFNFNESKINLTRSFSLRIIIEYRVTLKKIQNNLGKV